MKKRCEDYHLHQVHTNHDISHPDQQW